MCAVQRSCLPFTDMTSIGIGPLPRAAHDKKTTIAGTTVDHYCRLKLSTAVGPGRCQILV